MEYKKPNKEFRCENCNKLLAMISNKTKELEIKCPRCKQLNTKWMPWASEIFLVLFITLCDANTEPTERFSKIWYIYPTWYLKRAGEPK